MGADPSPAGLPSSVTAQTTDQSKKSYHSATTIRSLISLFQAQDADIPRLLPGVIESIQKDGNRGKARRLSVALCREITKAESSMLEPYREFVSACLRGETGIPQDSDLFLKKRRELLEEPTKTQSDQDLALLEVIRNVFKPFDKLPEIPATRKRTWFRIADQPDAIIRLVPPTAQTSVDRCNKPESADIIAGCQRLKSRNVQVEMPQDAVKETSPMLDSRPNVVNECQMPTPIDPATPCPEHILSPIQDRSPESGEIMTVPEATPRLCSQSEKVSKQATEVRPGLLSPIDNNPVLDQHESDRQSDRVEIDDILMEHDMSIRMKEPSRDGFVEPAACNVAQSNFSDGMESSDSDFDLELDHDAAEIAPEPKENQVESCGQSPDQAQSPDHAQSHDRTQQSPDQAQSPDHQLSESDLSLDLDEQPESASKPSPVSEPLTAAAPINNTSGGSSLSVDKISIQDIASELRRERQSPSPKHHKPVGSMSDFTKAFVDVIKVSPKKRRRSLRLKAKPPAAKKGKPEFSRAAQKFSTPCQFWVEMRCAKGDECPFSHEITQVRRTEICRYFMMGSCLKGDDCSHSHQVPCKFFHLQNSCRDADCRFTHDPMTEEELALFRTRVEEGYYLKPPSQNPNDPSNVADVENPFLV